MDLPPFGAAFFVYHGFMAVHLNAWGKEVGPVKKDDYWVPPAMRKDVDDRQESVVDDEVVVEGD